MIASFPTLIFFKFLFEFQIRVHENRVDTMKGEGVDYLSGRIKWNKVASTVQGGFELESKRGESPSEWLTKS